MGYLEEDLETCKRENIELKNQFNWVIKELNAITELLNDKYGSLYEETYEPDS